MKQPSAARSLTLQPYVEQHKDTLSHKHTHTVVHVDKEDHVWNLNSWVATKQRHSTVTHVHAYMFRRFTKSYYYYIITFKINYQNGQYYWLLHINISLSQIYWNWFTVVRYVPNWNLYLLSDHNTEEKKKTFLGSFKMIIFPVKFTVPGHWCYFGQYILLLNSLCQVFDNHIRAHTANILCTSANKSIY